MIVVFWCTLACLAAWGYLAVAHGMFWRTDVRLPTRPPQGRPVAALGGVGAEGHGVWPSVAVVVPARDEAHVLPQTLPPLLAQDYPGPARVVLVDDGSSDGTGAVARRLHDDAERAAAAAGGRAPLPLAVTVPGDPPPGWTGKLWALRHGVDVAGAVDLLLFTDADIAHGPASLRRLVEGAAQGWDQVSLMARLRAVAGWERLIVPAFVYFFAQLYPFRRVNGPGRTAAAAGGCVLLRRAVLEAAGGSAAIRDAVIDDVALARAVRRAGGRIWLGLASADPEGGVRSVRPYPRLGDLWRMVSRSAYTQLRYSPLLLAGTVVGLAWIYLLPPAAVVAGAVAGNAAVAGAGGAAWVVMAATYVPMLRYYRQPAAGALLLPVTAALYAGMTVDSARLHWLGRGAAWKNRTYAAPGPPSSADTPSDSADTPSDDTPSDDTPSDDTPSDDTPSDDGAVRHAT